MDEILKSIKYRGFDMKGLSSFQVDEIEKFHEVKLPENYKHLLMSMGLDGGGFMKGEDFFYDRIFELKDYASELLEEDESRFSLKASHFVFYSHQGYIFAYFDTFENNIDPSIYYYVEGDLIPSRKYNSLEEFLKEKIDSYPAGHNG